MKRCAAIIRFVGDWIGSGLCPARVGSQRWKAHSDSRWGSSWFNRFNCRRRSMLLSLTSVWHAIAVSSR